MDHPTNRIIHIHIPKTGGAALRAAFEKAFAGKRRCFLQRDERKYASIRPDDFDFYSGHIGFKTATRIGGDVIAIFRNPIDRFLSTYFFWRQLHERQLRTKNPPQDRRTALAARYDLDEFVFVIRDEPTLLQVFHNAATWQMAHGSALADRRELRDQGKSDDEILRLAVGNVEACAVIGIQERMRETTERLQQRFDLELIVTRKNVTLKKITELCIPLRTLQLIQGLMDMDLELYRFVLTKI